MKFSIPKTVKIVPFLVLFLFLVGCERTVEQGIAESLTPDGNVYTQTSPVALTEDELVNNTYYILHNNYYYDVWNTETTSYDISEDFPLSLKEDNGRLAFFTTEDEAYIPTLFVKNGDKLVYYSEDTLLDYITWERFEDLGYTVGVYNIDTMTNERCWADLSEDTTNVIKGSELYSLYDYKVDNVLLDKIGNIPLREERLKHGIIYNLRKNAKYDMDIYAGTNYLHYTTTANIHAFMAMELFASIEYETLRGRLYEIEIPDYFVNGYYDVCQSGIIRIVFDDYYSDETDFNKPLLFVGPEESKGVYSTFPALNSFSTTIPDVLGYVKEDAPKTETEKDYEDALSKIQTATMMEYDLFFPKDTPCSITITSKENTGDCYVRTGGRTYYLERTDGAYAVTIDGEGRTGTLTVSGFISPITISYEGCYRER